MKNPRLNFVIAKQGTFCNEFNDYLEKLSCMNGNTVIVGDV